MTLHAAVILDSLVVASCLVGLLLKQGMAFAHPATVYLAFHVLALSARGWAILGGSPGFLGVTHAEAARALNLADLALLGATVGWLCVRGSSARWYRSPQGHLQDGLLSDRALWTVCALAMPVGLLSLFTHARFVGSEESVIQVTTAYETLAVTWPGLVVVALIYRYGFKWQLMVPMIAYLTLMAFQGFGRYRLVLPVVLLALIWMDRRRRRWPPLRLVAVFACLAVLFVPLKQVADMAQRGYGASEMGDALTASISETLSSRAADQTVLDDLAITLSLVDARGEYFSGRPYLSVFTLPIPRPLWPEKPGLADHLHELSSFGRPLDQIGAVTTLPGDLYLNFGGLGVALGMFCLGWSSGRFYAYAYAPRVHPVSGLRLLYLLTYVASIQVARDGLISLPVFVFVHQAPLAVIAILGHWLPARAPEAEPRVLQAIALRSGGAGRRAPARR